MNEILNQLSDPLDVRDVDFRIQSINKGGYATILAYKNARVDMNRLDEVCGANWQDKYELIDGQLFCSIGIKIDKEWIWRQDVGVESYAEKTKGRASDAFKRAGFRWGIGRELYDYPKIQVKLRDDEFKVTGDKVKQTWNLKLKEWVWSAKFTDGKIVELTAKDEKGVERFNSLKKITPTSQGSKVKQTTSENDKPWLNVLDKQKNFTPQWLNVVDAINDDKIATVKQVREHYKVSKQVESKINEIFNYKTV